MPHLPPKDRQAAGRQHQIRPESEGLLSSRAQADDQENHWSQAGAVNSQPRRVIIALNYRRLFILP